MAQADAEAPKPSPGAAGASSTAADHSHSPADGSRGHGGAGFLTLLIGSIGVVYGDIGTSPLYAFKEAVTAAGEHGVSGVNAVLGILSLMVWTVILIVTLKYVIILLRADNNGEGG